MSIKELSFEEIMNLDPSFEESIVEDFFAKVGIPVLTPLQFAELKYSDFCFQAEVLLRPEIIPEDELRELLYCLAEHALSEDEKDFSRRPDESLKKLFSLKKIRDKGESTYEALEVAFDEEIRKRQSYIGGRKWATCNLVCTVSAEFQFKNFAEWVKAVVWCITPPIAEWALTQVADVLRKQETGE